MLAVPCRRRRRLVPHSRLRVSWPLSPQTPAPLPWQRADACRWPVTKRQRLLREANGRTIHYGKTIAFMGRTAGNGPPSCQAARLFNRWSSIIYSGSNKGLDTCWLPTDVENVWNVMGSWAGDGTPFPRITGSINQRLLRQFHQSGPACRPGRPANVRTTRSPGDPALQAR